MKIAFCHSKGSVRAAGERKWFLRAMRNFFNGKHWQEDRIACLLPREHYHQNTTTILHNMPEVLCHLCVLSAHPLYLRNRAGGAKGAKGARPPPQLWINENNCVFNKHTKKYFPNEGSLISSLSGHPNK